MIPELTLNADNRLPLYVQLKEGLQRALQEGFWPQEQALPSERELSEQFQISRATVRQAVQELEQEGWLVRRQGRGTFPSQPKVEQPLVMISSFTENMERAGLKAESRLISATLEPANAQVARALKLGPSGAVAVLTRLRLANGEPLMLERSHLNYALTPGLLEHNLTGSLYELLHQTYRLVFATGVERIEAISAEPWLAKLLELKRSTPVLYTERTVITDNGMGLEFTQRYGRADKCSFRVQLAGDNAQIAIKEAAESRGRRAES